MAQEKMHRLLHLGLIELMHQLAVKVPSVLPVRPEEAINIKRFRNLARLVVQVRLNWAELAHALRVTDFGPGNEPVIAKAFKEQGGGGRLAGGLIANDKGTMMALGHGETDGGLEVTLLLGELLARAETTPLPAIRSLT